MDNAFTVVYKRDRNGTWRLPAQRRNDEQECLVRPKRRTTWRLRIPNPRKGRDGSTVRVAAAGVLRRWWTNDGRRGRDLPEFFYASRRTERSLLPDPSSPAIFLILLFSLLQFSEYIFFPLSIVYSVLLITTSTAQQASRWFLEWICSDHMLVSLTGILHLSLFMTASLTNVSVKLR